MAILKQVRLYWVKLDPKKPDVYVDPITKKPGRPNWSVQLITNSPEQRDEWVSLKLKPKLVVHKDGPDEGTPVLNDKGQKEWRLNLRKNATNAEGAPAKPVAVVNGSMQPLDPKTIGNESIGNVSVSQLDRTDEKGKVQTNSYLMSIQITKLMKYVPQEGNTDVFEMTETEVVEPTDTHDGKADASDGAKKVAPKFDDDAF